MNEFYNEAIKNKYLESIENEGSRYTIKYVFLASKTTEEKLGMDLYNFSKEQIELVMQNFHFKTYNSARSNAVYINNYITWCITHGYRENNLNPMDTVGRDWYSKFIDRNIKIHYSYEEFLDLLEEMQNPQDRAFLHLIFEGVIGRSFSQLRQLTQQDILWETSEVYVKERNEKIKVSEECLKNIEKAIDQKIYYTYNDKTGEYNEKELVQSEFIFRNVVSPRTQSGMVNGSVFYTRLNHLKEEFNLEYLTPMAIRQSGMCSMAADLYKEYKELSYEQFAKIGEKYDYATVKAPSGEYYNTTLMREFISEKNLSELYNIDIQF